MSRKYPDDPLGQEAGGGGRRVSSLRGKRWHGGEKGVTAAARAFYRRRDGEVWGVRHVAGRGRGGSGPDDKGSARPAAARMERGWHRSAWDRGLKWAADRWVWVTVLPI
jgi:hypothetical protein